MKYRDEIPLNQWFLVEALSPPPYLYYLTLQRLIKEVKVILRSGQKVRSKNRFVSLLLSGVLISTGVGAPIQTLFSVSAVAAPPTNITEVLNASGCGNMVGIASENTTAWFYSYDNISFVQMPGQTNRFLSYRYTEPWYEAQFHPWIKVRNDAGEFSASAQLVNNGFTYNGCSAPFRSITPAVATTTAPSGTTAVSSTLTSTVSFVAAPINISLTYSWQSCTSPTDLTTCSTIDSATSSTYTLTSNEAGKYIRSIVVGSSTVNGVTAATTGTSLLTSVIDAVPDTTPPTISSVNSTKTDGSYKAGDVILIQVNFSESVVVTGTPQLTLETGATDRAATYSSGTGTNQLTFTYTVQAGDTTADLDYLATSSLGLNSGTIKDASLNVATLTLPSPTTANSLGANKALVIDTTAPTQTISGIDISADTGSSASDFNTSTAAQTITATLSAILGAGETLWGSVNGGTTYADISASVSTTAVSWASATLSGSSSIKFQVRDVAGNAGTTATQAYDLDTTAPTQTISGIDISADTGSSASDFTTLTASQTITATLSTILGAGETLWGSLDGGSTYTDISASVTTTAVLWASTTLSGSSSIKFQVRDVAGNAGTTATQAYVLDTTAPTTLTLAATAATSGSSTVTFTVTGNEPIACSTLSTASGTDFTYTGVSSLSGIVQTSPTVCTITAISTATLLGETATATIAASGSFSITDTAGNAQTTLTDSPKSTLVTIADTSAPVLSLTSASAITSTSANINFTSNEVGTYYYLIYAAADGPPDAATIAAQGTAIAIGTSSAVAAANIANKTGLGTNTPYKAYVIVKDAANNSSAVATIAFTTLAIVPGTPGAPTAFAGNGQATVTVSAPTSGGTPTSYTVTSSPGGATCTVTGASGSCTVTGLTNGTAYTFTSVASNTGGPSTTASAQSNSVTPFAPAPQCDASCEAAIAKVIADKIASDTAAKVVAEKVTVDKSAAEAAAKTAIDKAAAAVVAKAAADTAAATAAAVAKAAADAQQVALVEAEKAAAVLKSSTTTAAAKAAATATAVKAAATAANTVQAAAVAAKVAATAKNKATNANKQVDIAIGALGSKTAAASSAAQANAIAAAAKAAANAAAKTASDNAAAAKALSDSASREAADTAANIATEQKQAADAAAEAKIASDAALKATEEKIAAATQAQKSAEAVVKALDEKIALAEASVKAIDITERAAIDKKIAEITIKVAEAQKVADAANIKAQETVVAQEKAQAVAITATQTADTQATEAVAVKTESIAKTAVATKAAADASLAAKIATAAVAAAAKVPSRAVIVPQASSSSNKNSAKATITGLKPGQKIKVTVNVRPK